MRRALAIAGALAALGLVAVPAAAGGATAHLCSNAGFRPWVTNITARGTSCARARSLVRAWRGRLKKGQCAWRDGSSRPGVCTVQGWHCTATHTVNGQNYPVACEKRRGRKRVHFAEGL